jgi:hypothetical protein
MRQCSSRSGASLNEAIRTVVLIVAQHSLPPRFLDAMLHDQLMHFCHDRDTAVGFSETSIWTLVTRAI